MKQKNCVLVSLSARLVFLVALLVALALGGAPAIRLTQAQGPTLPTGSEPQRAPAAVADVPMYSSYTAISGYITGYAYLPLARETSAGWHTQIAVQNLTATPATVWVGFYDGASTVIHTETLTIPGWSPYLLDLETISGLPADYDGSVVLANPAGLIAVAVHLTDGQISYAYSGAFNGAYEAAAAVMFCDYHGLDSRLTVQNVGIDQATVVAYYSDGVSTTHSIPPYASVTLDQSAEGHNCGDLLVYSAILRSTQPVTAIVEHYAQDGSRGRIFESLPSGWSVADAPFVARNSEWWVSGIAVHNAGLDSVNVTATYEGQSSLPARNVAPNYAVAYDTVTDGLPEGYYGSFHLDRDNAQPLDVYVALNRQGAEGDTSAAYTPLPMLNESLVSGEVAFANEYLYFSLVPVSATLGANGRLWNTTLALENVSASSVNVCVYFYDQFGNQASGPVLLTLAPRVSTVLSNTLPSQVGLYSAVVQADGKVSGIAILEHEQSANRPPNTPANPSPANGATGVSVTTTLSWTGGDPDPGDTVTYDVYLGAANPPPLYQSGHTTTTFAPLLNPGVTYYWEIVATDNHEASTEGPVWSFTTASSNTPPNTPANPSPANGVAGVSVTTTLGWSGGDPDAGDTVTYDVYLGAANPPPLYQSGHTTTTFAPLLNPGVTYYWEIVATDNHEASTEGPVWSFTTGSNNAPNTPSNPSPADKAGNVSLAPAFSWTGGDPDGDPVRYAVYGGEYHWVTSTLWYSGTAVSFTLGAPLKPDTRYAWSVHAYDDKGGAASGPVWEFTSGAPGVSYSVYLPLVVR